MKSKLVNMYVHCDAFQAAPLFHVYQSEKMAVKY